VQDHKIKPLATLNKSIIIVIYIQYIVIMGIFTH
jgi:hypothetical protein